MVRPITPPGRIALDTPAEHNVGDYVEKFTGEARWFGWIVAKYTTRRGKLRYVVEVDPQGFQMIAVPSQLQPASEAEACPSNF